MIETAEHRTQSQLTIEAGLLRSMQSAYFIAELAWRGVVVWKGFGLGPILTWHVTGVSKRSIVLVFKKRKLESQSKSHWSKVATFAIVLLVLLLLHIAYDNPHKTFQLADPPALLISYPRSSNSVPHRSSQLIQ